MVEASRSHGVGNTHYGVTRVCNVMQMYLWFTDEFHNITWRLQGGGGGCLKVTFTRVHFAR